jgi:ribosomal protein RSM22 (predicted rRNA methylase)
VQRLWAHCADVLIIVEPGTPIGSAAVREARTAVLRVEARRQRAAGKHQVRAAHTELADEGDNGQRAEAAGDVVADASLSGVHVVAPCAHERRCPMDGTAQWCHFVQRVQRPAAHRAIKGGAPARTYQARDCLLPASALLPSHF